jgi:DNA mismatch repair protein MSH6
MSFFQKSSPVSSSPATREKVSSDILYSSPLKETKANSLPKTKFFAELSTPVPSSDALEPSSSQENMESTVKRSKVKFAEVPESSVAPSSPIRKVRVTFSPIC